MDERSTPALRSARRHALWACAALLGVALVLVGTRGGIGTFGDSVTYYAAAKSFLAGTGLTQQSEDGKLVPLLQFPPGYPVMLAAVSRVTHGDVLHAARAINLLAIACSAALLGLLTLRLTRSGVAAGVVALFYVCHGQTVGLHVRMLTEGTYVAMALAVMLLLVRCGGRGGLLALAGGIAGLSSLTRFAGVHLTACCALWIVLVNWRHGWRATIARVALFAVPAFALTGGWSLHNMILAGQATSRESGFHPPPWADLKAVLPVVAQWVIPVSGLWQPPAAVVAAVLWVAVPVWVLVRYGVPTAGVRARVMLPMIFVLTYLPFLWTSRTLFDRAIPFNYRLLLPMFAVSLVPAAVWLTRRWHAFRRRPRGLPVRCVAAVLATGLVLVLTLEAAAAVRSAANKKDKDRLGYSAPRWTRSETVRLIRDMPPDVPVYCNAADAVYLLTDRTVRVIPRSYARYGGQTGIKAMRNIDNLRKAMTQRHAVVVYFSDIKRDDLLLSEAMFKENVKADCRTMPDARVYTVPTPRPAAASRP